MSFFGDVVNGLIYRGGLPANAVSANRHLYASQGQKHLDNPSVTGTPAQLDQARNRADYQDILQPARFSADHQQLQALSRMAVAAGYRPRA